MPNNSTLSRTFISLAVLGTVAITPFIGALPASANSQPAIKSTVTTQKTLKTNSNFPFGNGSGTQNYKYGDKIKTFDFKVYGAASNAKIEVKKWNWNSSKWETQKTYSPASKGSGFVAYKIDTPKSAEGKTEAYKVHIPATASTKAWDGQFTYIGTINRVNINFPTTATPFGATKEVKAAPSGLPATSWSGVSKESGDFYIQELQKSKWVNVSKVSKTKAKNGSWSLNYAIPVKKAGTTATYRMYHYANNTAKAWAGSIQKISYKANVTDFYEKSGLLWNGVQKRWVVNISDRLENVQVLNGAGRTVYLQKYDSKKKSWSNVASSKLNNGNYAKGTLTIPKVKAQSTVSYRTHIPANNYYAADTSGSFTVKYEDPRKYTGFTKNVYTHVKKYCPNIIIEGAKRNGKWDGLAHWGEQRIQVVTGLTAGRFKKVSLHECAHIIQFNTYNEDRAALVKAADKVYGKGKGIEQMSDCMAFKMGADVKYYSYTNNCKGTRGTAAAKVLSGKRL